MFRKSEETGFTISDDPEEVNPICLILKEMNALTSCPEWGRCQCAVCQAEREELAKEAKLAKETKSAIG